MKTFTLICLVYEFTDSFVYSILKQYENIFFTLEFVLLLEMYTFTRGYPTKLMHNFPVRTN